MCKLTVFNFVTLNGFNKGANGDLSWHKHEQEEEHQYAVDNAKKGNILLFGRVTYELMAGFWPTPESMKIDP